MYGAEENVSNISVGGIDFVGGVEGWGVIAVVDGRGVVAVVSDVGGGVRLDEGDDGVEEETGGKSADHLGTEAIIWEAVDGEGGFEENAMGWVAGSDKPSGGHVGSCGTSIADNVERRKRENSFDEVGR